MIALLWLFGFVVGAGVASLGWIWLHADLLRDTADRTRIN